MPLYTCVQNNQKRLVMIHIPKTAGTALRTSLIDNQYKIDRALPKYSWKSARRKLQGIHLPGKHGTANQYKKYLGKETWESLFSFAFVRNPWDLMVSSYFYWLQNAPRHPKLVAQAEEVRRLGCFDDFINSVYGTEMINEKSGNIVDWITDEQRNIIVKFVGRFEDIENDWKTIGKIIDLEDSSLPHRNQSKHSSYQDYYNTQTRKLIEDRFQWVIQEFNYQF